jgi:hypothetical protein
MVAVMSIDEIRAQKAMVLLELKEAEEAIARLDKERAAFAQGLRLLASVMEQAPRGMRGTFDANYGHLTPAAAHEILSKLEEAWTQLAEATAKKEQFGL